MSYKKNIASNFITQIIGLILGFVTSILIARALGPEGKGYLAYFLLIIGLISSYGHFGITNATIYFQKRTKYKEQDVFNVNTTYLLILSVIILIIIVILKFNNIILSEYNWSMTIGGLAFILSTFIFNCTNLFYIGNERIVEINKYNIVFNFTNFISICVLYFLNILSIFSVFFLIVSISLIKSIWFTYKSGLKIKYKIDISLLKAEFKYGIIIYFSALFIYLNYRADQFLIKKMLGNSQLGVYSIAVTLAEFVFLVPGSVTAALSGKLYNIDKGSSNRKYITSVTIKYTFYICLILSIIGIFMTPLIPIVYGQDFAKASQVTTILFIGIVFASIGKVSSPYFFSKGKPQVYLFITSIVLLLNIILNIFLIPKLGINGAAIASTVSYLIYGLMHIYYFVIKEKFTVKELLIFNRKDFEYIKRIFKGMLGKINGIGLNKRE